MFRAAFRAGGLAVLAVLAVLMFATIDAVAAPCRVLTERFMSAACADCWSAADAADGAVLDWVVPAADGAPLALSATPDAARRAPGLPSVRALDRQSLLPSPAPVRLRVVDGIAFNGYIGLQLEITRTKASTAGMTGYMALVERIRAGRDGATVDRQLVRTLVGPLSLAELAGATHVRHLAAVRVPEAAQPERLASVGWVEDGEGRVVAFVESAGVRNCR